MKILNSFYLKILAIIFMTIDHIGVVFDLPIIYRIIGRLSFPLFAFLIYQGFLHTRNRAKYFLRLFIFGVALEVLLYFLSLYLFIPQISRNIFLTLSFGLLALMVIDSKYNLFFKLPIIIYLLYLSIEFNFDYTWFGILYILGFILYPKYVYLSFLFHAIILIIDVHLINWPAQYFAIFAWIFIYMYNDQKGRSAKYLFYLYYPLHLALLYLIAYFIT